MKKNGGPGGGRLFFQGVQMIPREGEEKLNSSPTENRQKCFSGKRVNGRGAELGPKGGAAGGIGGTSF